MLFNKQIKMIQTLATQQPQLILSTRKVAILCSLLALLCVYPNFVWANNNNQQTTYIQRPDLNGRPQLMVAIYCGGSDHLGAGKSPSALYHNQYLDIDSRKWRTDRDASAFCTQDKQVVLNYCRKVYPNHGIRNIVESSRPYKIDNWCKLGSSKRRCRTRLTVRPYRCLEGTFQSDALLVPEKCVFDHVHNKSICESPDNWNKTAIENCNSKGMKTQSFAMLQPCGLDVFAGVEFVCCPQPNSETKLASSNSDGGSNSFAQATNGLLNLPSKDSKYENEKLNSIKVDDEVSKKHHDQGENDDHGADGQDSDDDEDDDYDDDEDEYDDDSSTWNGAEKNAPSSTTTTTTTTTTTERPIDHYLSHFDLAHERDDFREAELAVEGDYRDKISHVMKEWSQLDARYEEMKMKDPEAAEEFKKKMTRQFQKTVDALEEEGTAQRHQLASMHAERAMSIINRRKKASMDCLTQALDRTPIRTRQVERCIVKLLKALEKDRTHTLRQYKNLLSLNTHEALHQKKIILDHLMTLNRAANQSIAMLDRSPVLVEKLKNKIITFWHQLRKISTDEPIVRESEIRAMEKYEEEVAQQKIERERQRLIEQEQQESKQGKTSDKGEPQKVPAVELLPSSVGYNVNNNNNLVVQEDKGNQNALPPQKPDEQSTTEQPSTSTSPVMPQHLPLQASDGAIVEAAGLQATEQHETSGPTHYQVDSTGFSHLKVNSPYHELSYSVKHEPLGSHFRFGYSTALASCVAMVVLAFFGVYKYYSKNSSRAYRRQGFAEVGRSSPEEKTVTNMQFSGYENPAYKFYEAEA